MSVTPIESLLSRRSIKFVQGPGPSAPELEQILRAAMCAPDHGAMRPWRFALIRGEAIGRFADLAIDAVRAGPGITPEKEASVRQWLAQVPLLIAAGYQVDFDNTRIPEQEQLLAAGAAVTNILNAAHALGFGAFWSTGLGAYLESVQEALGFDPLDHRFLGFIAIGTPAVSVGPARRPEPSAFVREWTGA